MESFSHDLICFKACRIRESLGPIIFELSAIIDKTLRLHGKLVHSCIVGFVERGGRCFSRGVEALGVSIELEEGDVATFCFSTNVFFWSANTGCPSREEREGVE